MDRTSWTAVIACIAALILWQWYYTTTILPQERAARAARAEMAAKAAPAPGSTPAAPATEASPARPAAPGEPASTPAPPSLSAQTEKLSTRKAEYVFSNDAGGIERAVLLMHLGEKEEAVFLNGDRSLPIGAIGFEPGRVSNGFEMRLDRNANAAAFKKTEPDGLEITKKFRPPAADAKNPYLVSLEIEFRNTGAVPIQRGRYFVSTGGAAPIHARDLPTYTKFDWMRDGKMAGIDVNWFGAGGIPFLGLQWSPPKPLFFEERPDVVWAGVTSQYFCTILTATNLKGDAAWAARFDTRKLNDAPVFGIQGAMGVPGFTLEPGASVLHEFTIYAGPKDLALLRTMGSGQDAALNFGMFGIISEVLLWAMNSLQGLTGSYAVAIILLTLIIKTGLWPVQNKATNEMRKMAALSPKMTELREKYKDDPQKLNEEMMKMYREYGVNPFSGCLPMLIQIPIFFGFYAMLGSAIELRNSSFLWVRDLSQPDTIGHFLGIPINLLPIVMAGTMVWQMVITPKSGDAMQQRIFYIMPVVFLAFCYNYASALALYWTTQNLFSIVQLYMTRNRPLPELEKLSVKAKREAAAKKKKRLKP